MFGVRGQAKRDPALFGCGAERVRIGGAPMRHRDPALRAHSKGSA